MNFDELLLKKFFMNVIDVIIESETNNTFYQSLQLKFAHMQLKVIESYKK